MNAAGAATAVLLVLVCATAVFSAVGVLLGRDYYERIHYMTPVATLGIWALAAAILVNESLSQAGIKAILIAIFVSFGNAVQGHFTARAGRVQDEGGLELRPEERQEHGNPPRRRDAA